MTPGKAKKTSAGRLPATRAAAAPQRAELLLEIGCEEIPAWMIAPACSDWKVLLEKLLREAALADGSGLEVFGGPRRLTAIVPRLRLKQEDVVREVTGPAKSAAYDAQGNPTRAAQGFAASKGVRVEDLFLVELPKGEFVAARQLIRGRAAIDVLCEGLPRTLAEIPWPKTMRWIPGGNARFIRAVRWIVALLGGKVVPFEFAGVRSGRLTWGHRFLGRGAIPVTTAAGYCASLGKNFVLVDPAERRKKISRELSALEAKHKLRIHEDPSLMDQVVYLNEYPSALLGDFDPGFLELPEEVLITVMRDHQKYFAVEKREGGLAPHFVAIINSDRDRGGAIRAGHERVLRARFADARFFWASDQVRCRLADNVARLDAVVYESSLGSYGLKVARLRDLAAWLASALRPAFDNGAPHTLRDVAPERARLELSATTVDRAALLCKSDLVTEMVREFTELQGIVGGLYARAQGETETVAEAIYDHYRPLGLEDDIPRSFTGCVVALADKLDALVGCFAVGKIPSGSSDPFALRRAAAGAVKLIIERRLPISQREAVQAAAQVLGLRNPAVKQAAALSVQVLDFIADRARFYFQEKRGYAYDEVKAAMAAGTDDLVDLADRIDALRNIRRTEDFPPLAAAFKRIRNIFEKSAGREQVPGKPDAALFLADEERGLYAAAESVASEVARLKAGRRYQDALERIATLRPAVDRFFEKVLVMAEDPAVRRNRLALLAGLLREFSTIADFSEIVTESTVPGKT